MQRGLQILLGIHRHSTTSNQNKLGLKCASLDFQLYLEDSGALSWSDTREGTTPSLPQQALAPPLPTSLCGLQPLPRSKRSRWHAQHLRLRFPAAIAELLLSRAEAEGETAFFFFYFPWEFLFSLKTHV